MEAAAALQGWEVAALEIAAGLVLAVLVGGPLWVGDGARAAAERARLAAAVAGTAGASAATEPSGGAAPAAFAAAFDRLFGPRPGSLGFILKSVACSLVTGAVLLATFLALNPLFLQSVVGDAYQRGAVFGQFLKVIVVVNLAVDYLCLVWCRDVAGRMARRGVSGGARLALFLVQDVAVKAGVLLVAMVFVFSGIAGQDGLIGRQQASVFASLPGVLWSGMAFENLSAIYIWSSFISSVWLWGWMLLLPALARRAGRLPLAATPMRGVAVVLGGAAALAYWIAVSLAA